MVNIARVVLWGKVIGTFRWNERYDLAEFEYSPDFVGKGIEPSPLMMPVREGRVYSFGSLNRATFSGLPGLLADSLPDTYGRTLFDRWLSLTGRSTGSALEALCFLGKRCMGALEFEPAVETGNDSDKKFEIGTLVDVAREALSGKNAFMTNINSDRKSAIAEILRLGTSAGGQRAKAIIAYNKTTGEVRSGQIPAPDGFRQYIIKLDGVSMEAGFKETTNYGRLEYSFYKLARKCGIDMTDCLLIEEGGRAHFMTERFDRNGNSKIHMQTLCGLAHYDFRMPGAYSYEQAFAVMRRLHLSYSQAEEMFRRMVFNVLVRNQDDHTKNISFLMDRDGKWRLSPAYDMGYAYNPEGVWTSRHQMSIAGKFDGISRYDLVECGKANGIKDSQGIIDELQDAVSSWPRIAKECEIPGSVIDSIFPNFQLLGK